MATTRPTSAARAGLEKDHRLEGGEADESIADRPPPPVRLEHQPQGRRDREEQVPGEEFRVAEQRVDAGRVMGDRRQMRDLQEAVSANQTARPNEGEPPSAPEPLRAQHRPRDDEEGQEMGQGDPPVHTFEIAPERLVWIDPEGVGDGQPGDVEPKQEGDPGALQPVGAVPQREEKPAHKGDLYEPAEGEPPAGHIGKVEGLVDQQGEKRDRKKRCKRDPTRYSRRPHAPAPTPSDMARPAARGATPG